jgi:hypothetical protein
LCAPLSARVMPMSAVAVYREDDGAEAKALRQQRNGAAGKRGMAGGGARKPVGWGEGKPR